MRRSALLAFALLWVTTPAAAEEYWSYETGDADDAAGARVRFALNVNIWSSTYDRPSSACQPVFGPEIQFDQALRRQPLRVAQQPSFSFCNHESSGEVGAGPGIGVQFRAFGPLYLTASFDLFYTEPSDFAVKNQWVVAVPFGIRLTWPHWFVRPIAEALITPVLYLTDDARDYTLGGRGGLAVRVGSAGDLSLLVGYQTAETLSNVSVTLGFQPIL